MIAPGSPLRRPFRPLRRGAETAMLRYILSRRFRLVVVAGLKRSGNHVFINWLLAQSRGPCFFVNDIPPQMDPVSLPGVARLRLPVSEPTLVISYEDQAWPALREGGLQDLLERAGGNITERKLCFVLRDPRNLMASRFRKWPEERDDATRTEAAIALWHNHVAALGASDGDFDIVPVWYPSFVTSTAYRASLSDSLGIAHGDRGLDEIPHYGHGSSFGGTSARPGEGVFDRWRSYAEDPGFLRLFADGTLDRLAEEVADQARPMTVDGTRDP